MRASWVCAATFSATATFCGLAFGQVPAIPLPATTLSGQISALLADPAVAQAHWGIAVTTLDGTPIYSLNERKLFRPASSAKLFTTAAAMALLGPKLTFETRVHGTMDETGVIHGNLTLAGGGDPSFASGDLPYAFHQPRHGDPLADLTGLADALIAKGLRHVTGNVVGDDYVFPFQLFNAGWDLDDAPYAYAAPPSALSVGDNSLLLTITPGTYSPPLGQNASVTLEQRGVAYYTVKPDVTTGEVKYPAAIDILRTPGAHDVRVFGHIPANASPDVEHLSIDDPAEYAAQLFRTLLLDRGVAIDGEASAHHIPPNAASSKPTDEPGSCDKLTVVGGECAGGCVRYAPIDPVLATHTSAPLATEIAFTLKTSQNLHAEILLHHLGRRATCADGSTQAGLSLTRAFLLHAGLQPNDFVFYDGSGLSTKDLVTPRATAQLLTYAATQPWFADWRAALPVGGVDGTLAERFKEAPLKSHVFAKTGTLGESRALAGYVDCASGKQLIFSILVDNHTPGSSADRVVMDKIVAAIAAAN